MLNYGRKLLDAKKRQYFYRNKHYVEGVVADGGTVRNSTVTEDYFKLCQQNSMYNSIEFAWLGEAGMKVSNGRVSKLKTLKYDDGDILLNPSLSDSSKWLTAIGWSISNNSAIATNSPCGNLVYQNKVLSIDSQYVISYEITSIVSGSVSGYINGNLGTPRTTPGKYYDIITPGIENTYVGIITSSDVSSCIIKNISVKRYSTTDATQPTTNNQPYLSGNIAPNEKLCLKNPNGDSNYMTHPTISFGASDAWSATFIIDCSASTGADISLIGDGTDANTIYLSKNLENIGFLLGGVYRGQFKVYLRNTTCIQVTYDGIKVRVFTNGLFVNELLVNSSFTCNKIGIKYGDRFWGKLYLCTIRSQALTQDQVTAEYNYLRSIYPEMESVQIGTQTWTTSNFEAVSTPMGTLIPEMQANGNVEKITDIADREFSSDTGWWGKWANATISAGKLNLTGNDAQIYKGGFINLKYYKITFTIDSISGGSVKVRNPGAIFSYNTIGTFTEYIKCNGTEIGIISIGTSTVAAIDDISIQEIGWSGSQELYDDIYAQTSGTAEEKTYAACKAAAMWCHYNNDPAIGAVYGKLYNWFAVKLLQMDIDKYNAANPTWGWRVPTQADFQALSTYLGGDAVAGGKMKAAGTDYWYSPNTGATNESGFSAIPGGYRWSTGKFEDINNSSVFYMSEGTYLACRIGSGALDTGGPLSGWGFSLRLIKS